MTAALLRRRIHLLAVSSGLWLALSSSVSAALTTLTGKVTDLGGAGIFNVTINFVDACTGAIAPATGNVTSSTGDFRATVYAGVYDLEFSPPAGSLYQAWRIRNFDLTVGRTLAPVSLGFGVIVSGRVNDSAGAGIPNVFVRFFPPGSSDRTFAVRDRTDLSGNFSIVVPAGTYDIKYGPPPGTRYLGLVRPSLPIPGNATLATVVLATGLLLSGLLTDSAPQPHPVVNANVDATNTATGEKLFLSHDRTDATGAFTLAIPPGAYVFGFKPEKCNLLVGRESAATTISADTTLPAVALLPGVLVKGTVTDTRAVPLFDVNTNFIVASTGLPVFTFDDHTDASGNYSAVIPGQGTYNIDYAPNRGVRLAGFKMTGVSVNNNSAQVLPTVQLQDAVLVTGRTVTYTNTPLADIDLDFFSHGTTTKLYTPNDHTDTAGTFVVAVPPGTYDIRLEPPSTTSFAAKRLRSVTVPADVGLGDVTIVQGVAVTGNATYIDPGFGTPPVDNLDMDFFNAYTGEKAETLHDNTDCAGNYSVLVPPGIYNVVFVPPSCNSGSSCALPAPCSLETTRIPSVVITSARSGLSAVLGSASLVSGSVQSSLGQPVAGVDVDVYVSGTNVQQIVSRDNTDSQGLFGVFVPPGTYDIDFRPPATAGLAPLLLNRVDARTDIDLGTLNLGLALTPSVTSIQPSTGPGSGGTAVTVSGANFQYGLSVTLGGFELPGVQILGPAEFTATTPAFPLGPQSAAVDLAVTNLGAPTASLPGAFTFTPPIASGITLMLTQSSPNITLTWPASGQAFYTIFRSTSPRLFGQAQVLTVVPATGAASETLTDYGADVDGAVYFYRVE
jgi:hypothetical protein